MTDRKNSVICPECGSENRATRFFCASCGAYLREEDEHAFESPERPPDDAPAGPAYPPPAGETPAPAANPPADPPAGARQAPAGPRRRPEPASQRRSPRRRGIAVATLIAFLFAVGIAIGLVVSALNGDGAEDVADTPAGAATQTTQANAAGDDAATEETEPEPPPRETTTTIYTGPVEQLDVASVSASSVLDPTDQNDYDPENMLDDSLDTAWNEGAGGVGEGEWFRLELDGEHTVRRLEIANGYQKDVERFVGNARIREMEIKFSDGSTQTAILQDEQGFQSVELGGVQTEWVMVTVTDAYGGDVWEDLAVSEVRVYGDPQ